MRKIFIIILLCFIFTAANALNKEMVYKELIKQNVSHPEIVLRQSLLETGNYKSKLCKNHNNLFGIKKGKKYKKYSHYSECIADYKRLISSRYKGGCYYTFLSRIKYASDVNYINKLKRI